MAKPTKHYGKWRIRWSDAEGQRCSAVFHNFTDAQKALRRFQSDADAIKAGLRKPDPPRKTFNNLAVYWVQHRASQKRNPKDDISIIRRHLQPFLEDMSIVAITQTKADEFKTWLRERGVSTKTQHNVLTLLISMLHVAHDLEWIPKCPKIKKPRLEERDYKYLKSEREIHLLLNSAKDEAPGVYEFYATAIYTGMRAGEVCGLHWDDVDFERRLITVQRS